MQNVFICLGAALLLLSCTENKRRQQEAQPATVEKQVAVPVFQADSAYDVIAKQVAFGPRVPNTTAHRQCGDFLAGRLQSYGAQVSSQTFEAEAYDGTMLQLRNIIGSYNPQASRRILLAAHWDTRPLADKDTTDRHIPPDGANDGGSGVGVLLEIARQIQQQSPSVGVDIILFDGEDYGEPQQSEATAEEHQNKVWWCLGSQYWAKHKHQKNYMAYYGILLDMVGGRDATFYQEEISRRSAGLVVKKLWRYAQQLGYGQYFVGQGSPEILDDHVYVNYDAGIPMVDIVEYEPKSEGFFAAYHHTHADNMDIISKATLQAVGQTVLHAVYHE